MTKLKKIALVTGVSRGSGLGFAMTKDLANLGYKVIITSRKEENSASLARQLKDLQLDVEAKVLDVTNRDQIQSLVDWIAAHFGKLDLLINNAAILDIQYTGIDKTDLDFVQQEINTNFIGAWAMIKYCTPLLKQSERGIILNISSGMGAFHDKDMGLLNFDKATIPNYSLSKLIMNGLTVKAAKDLKDDGILVNAACPGFTATYEAFVAMGARPIEESLPGLTWAATLPDGDKSGQFFRDKELIPW